MKIKFSAEDLQVGMFVSELNRPWIESPFSLEGLLIKEPEEIEQIQNISSHVYVETDKSTHFTGQNSNAHLGLVKKQQKEFIDTIVLDKHDLGLNDLQQQTHKANKLRDKTRNYIEQTFKEVYETGNVDVDKTTEVVSDLVENIIENPDAMVWLTHLKNQDEYTTIHSINVCIHSINFGRFLGLSEQELNILGLGALLHDIGKIKVPKTIIKKSEKLTNDEFALLKAHAYLGYDLLKNKTNIPPEALDIVLSHHERIDGSGYPNGKRGEEISYFARIVTIIDKYDELVNDKYGKDGMSPHSALNVLYKMTPGDFSQDLITSFIKLIGIYPIGSIVELNTGHTGVVILNNNNSRLKPIVGLVLNRKHEPYDTIKLLNLASEVWQKSTNRKLRITKLLEQNAHNINVQSVISSVLSTSI